MELISGISLEPVLRFGEDLRSKLNSEEMDYNSLWENNGWDLFYKEHLKKIGIENVNFARENCGALIFTSDLSDEDLKKLMRWWLETQYEPEFGETIPVNVYGNFLYTEFRGGLVLKSGYNHFIEPNCCTGLDDISGWEDLMKNKDTNWSMLWIGHPWVYCRFENDRIIFSKSTEASPTEKEPEERFSVSEEELENAVKIARIKISDFIDRMKNTIEEISKEPGSKVRVFYEEE